MALLTAAAENLYTIGTVGQYPQLAIANTNLINVPRVPTTVTFFVHHDSVLRPQTWFFRGGQSAR